MGQHSTARQGLTRTLLDSEWTRVPMVLDFARRSVSCRVKCLLRGSLERDNGQNLAALRQHWVISQPLDIQCTNTPP